VKAVVLIGGKGTRLRPLTYTVPKSMVLLRNRPYIQYMVDTLKAAGVDGGVLSMGYLPSAIQQYFATREDLEPFSLDYVVEDYPLGTAGGLKNAEDYLDDEGPFVAANGDVLTGVDLAEVIEAHRNSDALATLTLTSVEDPSAYGLVEVDHRLQVRRFVEKPGSDEIYTSLINAGIYVLEREVLNMIPKDREVSLEREVFPELLATGKLRAYVSSSYWRDIGTPRSYLAASHDVLSGAIGRSAQFQYMSVDQSVDISEDVTLLPPVSIADGCEAGIGATIGGRTSLARGCSIGQGAMVEGSILFEGARVGEGAIVRNSIIGPEAVVCGGSIVRGLSVLGAGCVVEEGNILDQGARVNPQVCLPRGVLNF
jgi:mannose-1-phosphate guanylyltransferase